MFVFLIVNPANIWEHECFAVSFEVSCVSLWDGGFYFTIHGFTVSAGFRRFESTRWHQCSALVQCCEGL